MSDKEKYDALVSAMIDQCIEMYLKDKEAMRREDWSAAKEYGNKYSALLTLIKSQGDEIFLMFYQRSYEAGCYSQEASAQ